MKPMKTLPMMLIAAAVLGVVFCLCRYLIWHWDHYEDLSHDERQQADQQKAGKAAFATLMVYLALLMVLGTMRWPEVVDIPYVMYGLIWIGFILGIGVYGTITIWTEAYSFLRKRWKTVVIVLTALSALHLWDFTDFVYTQSGIFFRVPYWVKLGWGMVLAYLALLVLLRRVIAEKE